MDSKITIIAILISTLIGLNGVLFQPKKNPDEKVSWKNINSWGKALLASLIVLGMLSIIQTIQTDKKNKIKEETLETEKIEQRIRFENEKAEQKDFSNYLIKVASICEGYTVIIRGTVDFYHSPMDTELKNTLKNMWFKYLDCKILAENKFGNYEGNLFASYPPLIQRYLNLRVEKPQSEFINRFESSDYMNPFFFELNFSNVKIVNEEKIMFAKHGQSKIDIRVNKTAFANDFNRLYGVRQITISDIILNDYEPIEINETFEFN